MLNDNQINQAICFEELWRPITEKSVPDVIENAYLISNRGRVWSNLRNRYLELVETSCGYYRVALRYKCGASRYHSIHRIVLIEFSYTDDYEGLQVNHFDGNKANNNVWNLEWTTGSANIIHAYRTNLKRQYHGQDCTWATINNQQAEKIAQLIASQKYSQQEIADIIGCTKSVVADIATGQNWKEICSKYNLDQYKRGFNLNLSDNDLHKLCKYWEDHKDVPYRYNSDRYRDSLKACFGIKYEQKMSSTMSRLYNGTSRQDISSQYDF